jgi:DNA-binding transcriptional MerR regulator
MLKPEKGGLSVKAVSRLSGVTAHTLRAWERRYAVVEPLRSENGRRVYTLADVDKLKLLGRLVELGHSIGNLARLGPKELKSLVNRSEPGSESNAADHAQGNARVEAQRERLLSALRALDFDELDRRILEARLDCPARTFVLDVASPLMTEVGALVAAGKLDITQEHAFSAILRNHLGELLALAQKLSRPAQSGDRGLPKLLFSTPEGDLHEFGILLAAILSGFRGFTFRFLGPNMPAEQLAKAASDTGSTVVVLGSVKADSQRLVHPLKQYVRILSKRLESSRSRDIAVWIGGYCDFDPKTEKFDSPLIHSESLHAFDVQLERWVAERGAR